jgi:putative transposase
MTETLEPVTDEVDQQELAEQLLAQAKEQGVDLVGPDGLLNQLTKNVLETALDAEMTEHLGYDKHDPAGRGSGNSRNGTRAKTVLTEIGPVEIEVPRDTDSSFKPQIVRKRQRRLTGVDEIVLSLTAKGLTTGEVAAPLSGAPDVQRLHRVSSHRHRPRCRSMNTANMSHEGHVV